MRWADGKVHSQRQEFLMRRCHEPASGVCPPVARGCGEDSFDIIDITR
jgi:hypothetical protein